MDVSEDVKEPVDPEVVPAFERSELEVLAVVAVGAVVGSIARYAFERSFPAGPGRFPWATFFINLGGSFALPFVVVAAARVWPRARLLRPALGTGLLGGFTTLSTFAVEQQRLFAHGAILTGFAYVVATLLLCGGAARLALSSTHRFIMRADA
jgi:fluoride exporter